MKTETSFLSIDPLKLDEELVRQPSLYHQYASRLADVRRDMDNAKAAMDELYARLQRIVRDDPSKYGIEERVTEGAVDSAIRRRKSFRKAEQTLINAKHKVALMDAAVQALEHKRSSLGKLVELQSMDYNSGVHVSGAAAHKNADRMNAALQKAAVKRTQKK